MDFPSKWNLIVVASSIVRFVDNFQVRKIFFELLQNRLIFSHYSTLVFLCFTNKCYVSALLVVNFICHYSFSILHNDTGGKHSHTSLAKPIYHLLDKNFRAKPIKTKAVFSSVFARNFFLMHIVYWLISCFNSSSSFGGTLFVFSNQREFMRKTLTLITGIFMTAVVTVTLVQFLRLIWQRVFDTVVSYTLAIF